MNDVVANPFLTASRGTGSSSTALAMQGQAVAEVQTRYLMAKRFPRDLVMVGDNVINAFSRPDLAAEAEYEYARGGEKITGPTIRTAEALAQQYGNIDFGFKEVSRHVGEDGVSYSDVLAEAIDLQSGARRHVTFVVRHWRDRKAPKTGYPITDERDIAELIGNQAQRRVRGCILAVIPGDLTQLAMKQVAVTLSANVDVTPAGIEALVKAFASFDVTKPMIEKRIQRRLDAIQPAQVISLRKVFNSLKDGMSTVEDWFESEAAATPAAAKTTSVKDIKEKAKAGPAKAAAPEPSPAPGPTPIEGEEVAPPAGSETQATATGEASAGAPVATFATVQDALNKAKTLEQLDDAATLIAAIGNRDQMKELNKAYSELREKLGGD